MNKLPKVSKIPLKKDISHNQVIYYEDKSKRENIEKNDTNKITIDDLFNSVHHYYKVNVIIRTKDKTYDTRIIGKTSTSLITIDDDEINFSDIQFIALKKSP